MCAMTDQATLSLSRTVPSARDRRLATIIMAVSFAAFVAVVPFATVHLPHIPAFIAAYSAALFICDLLTAALIASQMAQLRSPALLILTAGYCFDALIIIPHALSFPRLFAPSGVLRGGAQTTAWLYIFWHAVFPLFIIAYAWFDARGPTKWIGMPAFDVEYAGETHRRV